MHRFSYIQLQKPHLEVVPRQTQTNSTKVRSQTPDGSGGIGSTSPFPPNATISTSTSINISSTSTTLGATTNSSLISISTQIASSTPPSSAPLTTSKTSTTFAASSSFSLLPSSSFNSSTSIRRSSTIPVSSETLLITKAPTPTPSPIPTPRTTLVIPEESSTSIITTLPSPPAATKEAMTNVSNGFWKNTGAVAGTFTALGVLVVGLIIAFIFLRRKRNQQRQGEEEFYSRFTTESEMALGHSLSRNQTSSPSPSVAELSTQAHMDPYAQNHTHIPNYGPGYVASTASGLAPVSEQVSKHSNYSAPSMEQQSFYPVTSHAYSQNYHTPLPPRTVHNQQAGPRTSYQPSIDSFYGAP